MSGQISQALCIAFAALALSVLPTIANADVVAATITPITSGIHAGTFDLEGTLQTHAPGEDYTDGHVVGDVWMDNPSAGGANPPSGTNCIADHTSAGPYSAGATLNLIFSQYAPAGTCTTNITAPLHGTHTIRWRVRMEGTGTTANFWDLTASATFP